MTHLVYFFSRGFTGNPGTGLCRALGRSDAAIEAGRNLHGDKWKRGSGESGEAIIQPPCLGLKHAGLDLNAGGKKSPNAGAMDNRIRVASGHDDAPHARCQQSLGAGAGSSLMIAGFERDISSRASRQVSRLLQGDDLRMVPLVVFMKALAD